jgi:ligand-binding SRPBCC domain-containing protein
MKLKPGFAPARSSRGRLLRALVLAGALAALSRFFSRRGHYTLEREQLVPAPRDRVFAFFADPRNLPQITPPSVGFEITNLETMPLAGGTMQEYRIRWLRVPLRWESLIAEFEKGHTFTDVQTRGPYAYWRHEHTFEDVGAEDVAGGATLVRDRVQYALPFGLLGALTHELLVRRQLRAIFDYRANVIEDAFRI